MVDFTELKYAQMLSGRLENFRIRNTNPYKINFRCPICGDSQKSRSKSRGWLLESKNTFHFYCHNCASSQSFSFFLKGQDQVLYNDYVAEKFVANTHSKSTKDDDNTEQFKTKAPTFNKTNPLSKIKKVSQLKFDPPVKKYIQQRQIPPHQHYRLYYAPKFKTWINSVIPNKFENVGKDEPRLIIPFLDENGKCFGVSARGFSDYGMRYITIMFEDRPKIFGLDKVDFNDVYYITEGAIDSFFLQNAVAMAGAEGNTKGVDNTDNAVFVFDAEPRNKEIHKRMEKVIEAGLGICIWPSNLPGKDINEMVLEGINAEKVIEENTYRGLTAKLKFADWRKT
jgi:transcription elongation factor Elf1